MRSGISFAPGWILAASGVSSAALLASALFLGRGSQDRDRLRQQASLDEVVASVEEDGERWLRTTDRTPSWRGPARPGVEVVELRPETAGARLLELDLAEARRAATQDPVAALQRVQNQLAEDAAGFELAEGHFTALQLAVRTEDRDAVRKHLEVLSNLDGQAARQGTSYRLLSGLAACSLLQIEERGPLALGLARELEAGNLALPAPSIQRKGTRITDDPWRAELRRRIASAALGTPQEAEVRSLLQSNAEAEAWLAVAEFTDSSSLPGWTWIRLDEQTWLAQGQDANRDECLALLTNTQLEDAFLSQFSLPSGFELRTREHMSQEPATLGAPVRFPSLGDGPYLQVLHRDPDSLTQGTRTQRSILRIALAVLAIFSGVAGLATARALRRERELAGLRTRFVASVSHDLRTPLASILLTAENLEEGRVRDEDRRRKYYRAIRGEARRLARLVDDVLDFARLERGQGPSIQTESVDLEAFVDGLFTELHERCQAAEVTFESQVEGCDQTAEIDPDLVTRCVSNLFENALRHSGSDWLRVTVQASAGRVEFELEDRGRGLGDLPPEKLFEPYVRGRQDADSSARGGTGLGLAIVRELARAHGGDARLRNAQPGVHARVWFAWNA